MKLASFKAIVEALNGGGVRFIVVGGIAVIAHGYGRTTQDVDLVIQLQSESIARTFEALASLGYQPCVPVSAADLGDAELRLKWVREKGMTVLNFHSDAHRETPVDVFVTEPFDFEKEYDAAFLQKSGSGGPVRVLRLEALLRMKAGAGRKQDLADIDELNLLNGRDR